MTKEYDDRGLPVGMQTGPRRPIPDGLGAPDAGLEEQRAGREMSNAIVQAQSAHQAVLAAQRDAVHKARACGERLIELRNKVGEREWPKWVSDHAGFTLAKARFYVKLAGYMSDPTKAAQVEYASLNQIEMIVAAEPG